MPKNEGMIPSSFIASSWSSRIVCAWIITGRRSPGPSLPMARRTALMNWSAAASPLQWTWICQPFRNASSTKAFASSSVIAGSPAYPLAWPAGGTKYGFVSQAVLP